MKGECLICRHIRCIFSHSFPIEIPLKPHWNLWKSHEIPDIYHRWVHSPWAGPRYWYNFESWRDVSVAFLEKHALELEDIQEKMSKMSQKMGKHGRHIGIVVISPSRMMEIYGNLGFLCKKWWDIWIDKLKLTWINHQQLVVMVIYPTWIPLVVQHNSYGTSPSLNIFNIV